MSHSGSGFNHIELMQFISEKLTGSLPAVEVTGLPFSGVVATEKQLPPSQLNNRGKTVTLLGWQQQLSLLQT